jgi:hypothetical protein
VSKPIRASSFCPELISDECILYISFHNCSYLSFITVLCIQFFCFLPGMEANEALLNSEHRFKDGMAKNAARIPKAKWDEHKELLCSLHHQMTISEVLVFMWAEHDFVVK